MTLCEDLVTRLKRIVPRQNVKQELPRVLYYTRVYFFVTSGASNLIWLIVSFESLGAEAGVPIAGGPIFERVSLLVRCGGGPAGSFNDSAHTST